MKKINKAQSIDELLDLAKDELNRTEFSSRILEDLISKAYSLGFRAGRETGDSGF